MASKAEAARRRRRTAARRNMRPNMETCGARARRPATCWGVSSVSGMALVVILSFTSEGGDGVGLHRTANGGGACAKGHEDGDRENDREEHGFDGNLRVENRTANLMSEERSSGESG